MLTNAAVVFFLLAPVEFVLAQLKASFKRIGIAIDQAQSTAESAMRASEENTRSLEEVRRTLIERQAEEHESELDLYRSITRDPSRESLVRGLRHATEVGVISQTGVRSPVWETNLHYRFVTDESDSPLVVRLETDAGLVLSSHHWDDNLTPEEFYQNLVQAVRKAGGDLGVGLNDPTESVQGLSEMLIDVTRLRSQELLGYRSTLRLIIERVDGWYFTDEHVVPENDLRYTIAVDSLNEMDWEEHLRLKRWYGASAAISFARRLYKTATPAE